MPIYEYECSSCGQHMTMYNKVDRRDKGPKCCGIKTRKIITPMQVMPDIAAYKSMIDGSIITSRNKHRAHLKDHNCIELGNEKVKPGITPVQTLSREQRHEDIQKAIAEVRNR